MKQFKKIASIVLIALLLLTEAPIFPIKAEEISVKAVSISLGNMHSGVLDAQGRFWAWGRNNGELGNGKSVSSYFDSDYYGEVKPVLAKTDKTFQEFSLSRRRTYLIGKDGGLYRTGIQAQDSKSYTVPTRIMGDTLWQKVSGTTAVWGAIDKDGNLFTWGDNSHGQIGNGLVDAKTYYKEEDAVQVTPGTKYKEIAVGNSHVGAIDINGHLYMWGNDNGGVLGNGNGNGERVAVPELIMSDTTFSKVACGMDTSGAIDSSGNLYMWGDNFNAEVGIGILREKITTPQQIMAGTKFKELALYNHHAAAIDIDGNLYTWGWNDYGQIGNGKRTNQGETGEPLPVQIMPGTKFISVDVGESHTGAIDIDGNVWMWGSGRYGQLGNGNYVPEFHEGSPNPCELSPVKITLGGNSGLTPISKKLEVGDRLTLKADKKISKWEVSDKSIAKVKKNNKKSATLTAEHEGSVTVTAYTGKGKKQTAYKIWNVTVTERTP